LFLSQEQVLLYIPVTNFVAIVVYWVAYM